MSCWSLCALAIATVALAPGCGSGRASPGGGAGAGGRGGAAGTATAVDGGGGAVVGGAVGNGGVAGASGGSAGTGGSGSPGTGGTLCGANSQCPQGQKCCAGGVCADVQNDILNCGGCNFACTGDHPFCDHGICVTPLCFDVTCAAGAFCCGDQCCAGGQLCCVNSANSQIGCADPVNDTCPLGSSTVTGQGGASGASGQGGTGGASGGTPQICAFHIAATLSSAIPTVGVVDWSADLAGLSAARIEFNLTNPRPGQINTGSGGPIDITGSTHHALMLGMKPGRPYTFRIVATAGGTDCVSPDQTLTTAPVAPPVLVTRTAANAAAQARGFIIATSGVLSGHGAGTKVYVIDGDGDVVWWTDAPNQCSRALMDWQGANMWMLASNPSGPTTGEMRRVAMDGTGAQSVASLAKGHHDFAVLPGGVVAAMVYTGDSSGVSDLVELSPDGTLKTVVRLDGGVYKMGDSTFHANAVRYHPADDSYTVGDRDAALIVKLTRAGQLLWQFGASCTGAVAPACGTTTQWTSWVHGHQVLDDGNLLVFNNGDGMSMSPAIEYSLAVGATSLTATPVWSYVGANLGSLVLGDVQRLPNGNTLVTYSTQGTIQEVTSSGALVQTITNNSFGYVSFRETLYGPPATAAP